MDRTIGVLGTEWMGRDFQGNDAVFPFVIPANAGMTLFTVGFLKKEAGPSIPRG